MRDIVCVGGGGGGGSESGFGSESTTKWGIKWESQQHNLF